MPAQAAIQVFIVIFGKVFYHRGWLAVDSHGCGLPPVDVLDSQVVALGAESGAALHMLLDVLLELVAEQHATHFDLAPAVTLIVKFLRIGRLITVTLQWVLLVVVHSLKLDFVVHLD